MVIVRMLKSSTLIWLNSGNGHKRQCGAAQKQKKPLRCAGECAPDRGISARRQLWLRYFSTKCGLACKCENARLSNFSALRRLKMITFIHFKN